jgi:hypothetical protein
VQKILFLEYNSESVKKKLIIIMYFCHILYRLCTLSTHTFIIYMDADTSEWQMQLESHFSVGKMILDTLLFADYKVIFAKLQHELQLVILQHSNIKTTYNLEIWYVKTNSMAFRCKYQIRSKIILNSKTVEQLQNFNYTGFDIYPLIMIMI